MRRWLPLLLALGLLGACTGQELTPREVNPGGFAPWTEATPVYRIAPGDKLRVQFQLTPEMNESVLVGPDGMVALRASGQVQVGGMPIPEAEAAITQASRRMLKRPIVTVGLEEAGGALVLVGGAVRQPGAYPLTGPRGALDAVLLARGFEEFARTSQVVLIRRGADNRPMMRTLDMQSLIQGTATEADVPLFPGDIVYVPRSRISEANVWVDQYVTRLLPFSRSFGYSINRIPTTGVGF